MAEKAHQASYFFDVCIDRDSLALEFPQILRQIHEMHMKFIFAELGECNLHVVHEFYANWAPNARSHFVTVHGGLAEDCDALFDTGTTLHRYHLGLDLFGIYLDDGHRGVPEEHVDYMAPLFLAPLDITRTNGPDPEFAPTLTTAERHRRDELIMARMYDLEMFRHQNGCLASTDMHLGDVERRYPLNAHAKVLLGIGPEFREPVNDDISTVEERFHTSSNVKSDFDKEVDPTQVGDEAEGDDAMED
ncbi:hypothetical protein H5410_005975 [Solanum commersonii]|uniref:Uncharacterized protein n=1 Tax=Solanum commersonii TaxID=4109 RepID=A0A9J6A830_SOLCO|nr:hypothetical protein H5410_005975 [Solanum commersonii]